MSLRCLICNVESTENSAGGTLVVSGTAGQMEQVIQTVILYLNAQYYLMQQNSLH